MATVKDIINQQIMEEFFRDNLSYFPGAVELIELKIHRHDPSFVLDRNAILAEYRLKLKMKEGSEQSLRLRGSADPSYKRKKHYQILSTLYKNDFNEGVNIVAKPVGYFEEMHLLLYHNVTGQSLYDRFKWTPENEWLSKTKEAMDWLADFHEKKPMTVPEAELDWKEERQKFQTLIDGMVKKFPDNENLIRAVTDKMLSEEKELINEDKLHLVHGDYQPHNILFSDFPVQCTVIDFNDSMYYEELYDLAYFLTQTKTMLFQIHDKDYSSLIQELTQYYLKRRGLTDNSVTQRKLNLFRLKTLMHIKAVTELKTVKNIIPQLEAYVASTV